MLATVNPLSLFPGPVQDGTVKYSLVGILLNKKKKKKEKGRRGVERCKHCRGVLLRLPRVVVDARVDFLRLQGGIVEMARVVAVSWWSGCSAIFWRLALILRDTPGPSCLALSWVRRTKKKFWRFSPKGYCNLPFGALGMWRATCALGAVDMGHGREVFDNRIAFAEPNGGFARLFVTWRAKCRRH